MVINKSLLKTTKAKAASLVPKAPAPKTPSAGTVEAPSITANVVAEKIEGQGIDLAAARQAVLEEIKKPAAPRKPASRLASRSGQGGQGEPAGLLKNSNKNSKKKVKTIEEEAPTIFKTPLINPAVLDQPPAKELEPESKPDSPLSENLPIPSAGFEQEDLSSSKLALDKRQAIFKEVRIIGFSILSFLVFFLVVSTLGLYLGRWQGKLADRLTAIIPYPAVLVNGQVINLKTFLADIAVLDDYLIRQGQPMVNEELRRQVMSSLIKTKVVAQLVASKNLTLSEEDFSAKLNLIFPDAASQTEAQNLVKNLYGWDWPTYLAKVVKPLLLAEALEKDFNAGTEAKQLKDQLLGIRQLIEAEAGRFAEIAAEVNQDDSKSASGDLGWIKLGETVPEFEFALLQLKVGELSQMVETRYGYHLIKLEEKMDDDNEEPIFHASHIFLKRPDFNQYLNEEIKKAKVISLIRI